MFWRQTDATSSVAWPPNLAWILSESAQRAYLLFSGLVVFFLGAQILYLQSEAVPYDLRVYHWPSRLSDRPYPVRAMGKDLTKRRMIPVAYCGSKDPLARPTDGREALPLELLMRDNQAAQSLCIQRTHGPRTSVELEPPPAVSRTDLTSLWTLVEGQAQSHASGYKNFPFRFLLLPETGSFNPRKESSWIRLWVNTELKSLSWADKEKKEHPVEIGDDGFYRVPLRRLLLQGKIRVIALTLDEKRYPIDFTFQGISRDLNVSLKNLENGLSVIIQAVAVPEQKRTQETLAYCSIFAGNARLESFTIRIPPDQSQKEHTLSKGYEELLPLAIQCDTTPYGTANDSSWAWIMPAVKDAGFERLIKMTEPVLEKMLGTELSTELLKWAKSNDPMLQNRFLNTISHLVIPRSPEAITYWSDAPKKKQTNTANYRSKRLQLLIIVMFLFISWIAVGIASMRELRRKRIESLEALSLDGELDELPLDGKGNDALEHPRSRLLAMIVLAVAVLGMAGLLWVLTSF